MLLKTARTILKDYGTLKSWTIADIVQSHKVKGNEHEKYLRDLFKKKRTAVTHMLVIMISDEQRNKKPYAIPGQYVPYKSLTNQKAQELADGVKEKWWSLAWK